MFLRIPVFAYGGVYAWLCFCVFAHVSVCLWLCAFEWLHGSLCIDFWLLISVWLQPFDWISFGVLVSLWLTLAVTLLWWLSTCAWRWLFIFACLVFYLSCLANCTSLVAFLPKVAMHACVLLLRFYALWLSVYLYFLIGVWERLSASFSACPCVILHIGESSCVGVRSLSIPLHVWVCAHVCACTCVFGEMTQSPTGISSNFLLLNAVSDAMFSC